MLAMMLVMESVSVPAKGEVQTLSESVDKYAEESVSANFVFEEETEVSANAIKKEDEETDAEKTAGTYSGTDGDLEWSIDAEGCLTVSGEGDYEETPEHYEYEEFFYVMQKNRKCKFYGDRCIASDGYEQNVLWMSKDRSVGS